MQTRAISWLKGASRDFEAFPVEVQREVRRALTVAAEGGKSDAAKPLKGVDVGVSNSPCGIKEMPSASSTPYAWVQTFG